MPEFDLLISLLHVNQVSKRRFLAGFGRLRREAKSEPESKATSGAESEATSGAKSEATSGAEAKRQAKKVSQLRHDFFSPALVRLLTVLTSSLPYKAC